MSSRRCESLCFIIMCSKFLQPQWWRAPVTSAGLRHCSVSSAAVALHIAEAGAILYLQGFSYNIKDKICTKKEDRRQKSTMQIRCSWHIQKYGQKCCKCSVMVQKNCEVVRRWDGISVSLNIWQAASRCTLCTALLWMKRAQTWRQGWLWQIPCRVHQFGKWYFRKAALMAPFKTTFSSRNKDPSSCIPYLKLSSGHRPLLQRKDHTTNHLWIFYCSQD